LQNSTDAKIIEGLELEVKKKQNLLNDTVNLLGAEDIKSLSDIENLLKGQTLKELKQNHRQELAHQQKSLANAQETYLAKTQALKEELDFLEKKVIAQNQNY